jgi:hypothetical protein
MHRLTVMAAFAAFLAASSAAYGDTPDGSTVGGIRCEATEQVAFHIHQHLAIFDYGRPVPIPPDVGRPLLANCFYWLHTHTPDGIIHVESPTVRQYYLGDFFAVWGQPLSRTRAASARVGPSDSMRIWVNGSQYSGDPRKIELDQHTDITIEVGPPWKAPVPFTGWQGL